MNIQLINVPYDSGFENARTGLGPVSFLKNGIDSVLRNNGHTIRVSTVRSGIPFAAEIMTTFDVNRVLAEQVRSAVHDGYFPLVLSGNCNSCVGTISGLDSNGLGIIWFDAHGDFNTPDTTTTGFLDGMGLAMAAGRCWKTLLNTIAGFNPVPEDCMIHVGSRDVDPEEKNMFQEGKIPLVVANPNDNMKMIADLKNAVIELKARVDSIYLHIDMDVLETEQGKPNHLAVPGGLPLNIAEESIRLIKRHFRIAACTIASYDPAFDEGNSVLNAGIGIMNTIVE